MKDPFNQIIEDVLDEGATKDIIRELGIQDASPGEQETVISGIGETIMARLVVEILKALPQSEHATFDALLASGDAAGIRKLLSEHIPDIDAFLQHEVTKEYEATKTLIQQMSQET